MPTAMPDKGIQIVVALLEKWEAFVLTKETDQQLAHELLRAESLGYVQREEKSALYTLSEKGRKLIYSDYDRLEREPVPAEAPQTASIAVTLPEIPVPDTTVKRTKNVLLPAYISTLMIMVFFFIIIVFIWTLDL